MAQIAVSSCDRDREDSFALLVVDDRSPDVVRYSLGVDGASARGLAKTASHLYCAYVHDGESFLAILERGTLRIEERIALASIRDVHSIVLRGDDLFAVSTGDDRIVRVTLRDGRSETIWRASERGEDTHHLNGLTLAGEDLVCSAFGPKMGPAWADAMDGYLYDLTHDSYLVRGVYHPHSVCAREGELYFCESALGKVRTVASDLRYLRGYARGLAVDADVVYAASSVARRRTGSAFVIDNPADDGASFGRCEIVYGPRGGPVQRVDLSAVAREVYDLLILS